MRNIIVTKELLEQVLPENLKLANRFLKEKNTRSSDLTIEGYKSDLNIFFCWNIQFNSNKLFTDIRKIELADYFTYCVEELKWGSARFSRAKSTLSSFSNFLEKFFDEEYPKFRNIVLKAVESMPRVATREKTVLSEEQMNSIFEYLEKENEYQAMCWLSLAIGSGARFAELLRFTVDVIDENCTAFDEIFLETSKTIKTKGRTKAGKMLTKYIIKDLFWEHYQKWLPIRKEILEKNKKDHNFIFVKNNGDPLEEGSVRGWVTKIEEFLGIPFYPHLLRHYFVSYLAKANLPFNLIQDIGGWNSVDMVNLYCDLTSKDKDWKELENLKESLRK